MKARTFMLGLVTTNVHEMIKIAFFVTYFLWCSFLCCDSFRVNCYVRSEAFVNGREFDLTRFADKCTFITFSRIGIDRGVLAPLNEESVVRAFTNLKKNSSISTKALIAVPGGDRDDLISQSMAMSRMVSNKKSIDRFVVSVLSFLEKYKFDGLVIYWIFPGIEWVGGSPEDKKGLSDLVKKLHEQFELRAYTLGILGGRNSMEMNSETFDFPLVSHYVDFIDVQATHYVQFSMDKAWHLAPLKELNDSFTNSEQTVSSTINYWIDSGANPMKINLWTTLEGYSQKLVSGQKYGPLVTVLPQNSVTYDNAYSDICNVNGTELWIEEWAAPVMVNGSHWLTYENERSLKAKVKYARDSALGGMTLWAIDIDDIDGKCGKGKIPMLTALVEEVENITQIIARQSSKRMSQGQILVALFIGVVMLIALMTLTAALIVFFNWRKKLAEAQKMIPDEEQEPYDYFEIDEDYYSSRYTAVYAEGPLYLEISAFEEEYSSKKDVLPHSDNVQRNSVLYADMAS